MSQLFYLVEINCTIAIEYIANPHECLTLPIRVQVVTLHSYPRTYLASNLGACTFYQTSSPHLSPPRAIPETGCNRTCLLYTSDAADDLLCVDLGGRRIIKKKKKNKTQIITT